MMCNLFLLFLLSAFSALISITPAAAQAIYYGTVGGDSVRMELLLTSRMLGDLLFLTTPGFYRVEEKEIRDDGTIEFDLFDPDFTHGHGDPAEFMASRKPMARLTGKFSGANKRFEGEFRRAGSDSVQRFEALWFVLPVHDTLRRGSLAIPYYGSEINHPSPVVRKKLNDSIALFLDDLAFTGEVNEREVFGVVDLAQFDLVSIHASSIDQGKKKDRARRAGVTYAITGDTLRRIHLADLFRRDVAYRDTLVKLLRRAWPEELGGRGRKEPYSVDYVALEHFTIDPVGVQFHYQRGQEGDGGPPLHVSHYHLLNIHDPNGPLARFLVHYK
jgi:hypothetical protein